MHSVTSFLRKTAASAMLLAQGFSGCVNSDIQTKTGDQFATSHKW